jgi:general secretion pathway protein I
VKKILKTKSKSSASLASLCDSAAFTLLEVMIAIAVMAIALTTLYGSQSRSLSYATEAHFNIVASSLAAAKLAELQSGISELVSDSGDFGDEFPGYGWQLEVEDAYFEELDALAGLKEGGLQQVDLKVEWSGSPYRYALRYYGYHY